MKLEITSHKDTNFITLFKLTKGIIQLKNVEPTSVFSTLEFE